MRIFDHPNMTDFRCPICGTDEDKPVTLIGISGTEDGRNIEARQYHIDCLTLIEYKNSEGDGGAVAHFYQEDLSVKK